MLFSTRAGVATVLNPRPHEGLPCPPSPQRPTCRTSLRRSARGRTCPCCCRAAAARADAAKSRGVVTSRFSAETIASAGEPMGATRIGPRVRWPKTCAGRGAVKVTMASASRNSLARLRRHGVGIGARGDVHGDHRLAAAIHGTQWRRRTVRLPADEIRCRGLHRR